MLSQLIPQGDEGGNSFSIHGPPSVGRGQHGSGPTEKALEMYGKIRYQNEGVEWIRLDLAVFLCRDDLEVFNTSDIAADMTEKQKVNGTGVARLKRAITCSYAGMAAAWKNEEAFRQELMLGLILVPLACWLGASGTERALLVGSLLLVLIVELLNTAVEVVVNRISVDRHELSGLAKDLGSAAVSMALVNACIIWLLVLFT